MAKNNNLVYRYFKCDMVHYIHLWKQPSEGGDIAGNEG